MGNENKTKQLGMPYGTASNRLRKMVLFHLLQKHEEDVCYQCNAQIENIDELSIEHKQPWLGVSNDLFWSIDNIAFSHLVCNVRAGRKVGGNWNKIECPEGTFWCNVCKKYLPVNQFSKNKGKNGRLGFQRECKACRRKR